jgi:hypothetical protein
VDEQVAKSFFFFFWSLLADLKPGMRVASPWLDARIVQHVYASFPSKEVRPMEDN